jgi:hypothetical protein
MEPEADVPPASAMLCALRMFVVAHLRTMPRRKAERFLREVALIVVSEESVRSLFPSRPKHERRAQAVAQADAAAWVRHLLPELVRALPPE